MNINASSLVSPSSQHESWDSALASFNIHGLCSHRLLLAGPSHTNTADTSVMSLQDPPRQVQRCRQRSNTYPSRSWSRSNSGCLVEPHPECSMVRNGEEFSTVSRDSVHCRGHISDQNTVRFISSPLDALEDGIDRYRSDVADENTEENPAQVPMSLREPRVLAAANTTTTVVAPAEQEGPPAALSWGRTTSTQSSCLTPPPPISVAHTPPPESPLVSPVGSGANANFTSFTTGLPAVSVVLRSVSTALTNSGFLGPTLAVFTPRHDSTGVASDSSSLVQPAWGPATFFSNPGMGSTVISAAAARRLNTGLLRDAAPSQDEETVDHAATTNPFLLDEPPTVVLSNHEVNDRQVGKPSSTTPIGSKQSQLNQPQPLQHVNPSAVAFPGLEPRRTTAGQSAAPTAAFRPLSLSTSRQPSSRQRSASAVSLLSGDLHLPIFEDHTSQDVE